MNAPEEAEMLVDMRGKFAAFKAGEPVIATRIRRTKFYRVAKVKRIPSGILKEGLPLVNELCGVPEIALKFIK